MVLDPKLRDVLDFLPCEPCLERPSPDQEVLCSICHRLNRTVALKCQVSLVDPELGAPSEAELEAAREEARLKQQEFEDLRAQQEADTDAVDRLRIERDQLLARQQELEDRLAALEAQSHGGKLSFVEDEASEAVDEVVEFARVDLGPSDDDMMEFESLGSAPGYGTPDPGAWEDAAWDEAAPLAGDESDWQTDETSWEDHDTPAAREAVAWDDTEAAVPYGEQEEAPWETVDEPTDWSGHQAEEEGRAHAQTPDVDDEDLDDQTRADLSELEMQLAELERELKKRTPADEDEA